MHVLLENDLFGGEDFGAKGKGFVKPIERWLFEVADGSGPISGR